MSEKTKKFVRILNIVDTVVEYDIYEVSEFSVVYDTQGVLRIDSIIEPPILAAFYAPGVWKYIEIYEEGIENEQEEEEEESTAN